MKTSLPWKQLAWVCAVLLAGIALVLLVQLHELITGPTQSDNGTDFGIEGRAVRTVFAFTPKKVRPGDSLSIDIHLEKIPGVAAGVLPPGVANESGGFLSGALVAPDDCKFEPADPIVWPTSGTIEEVEWHWVVDCATEGRKAFEVTITFKKGAQSTAMDTSDVVAYKGDLAISVSKSVTQVVLGGLSATFLAAVGALVSYLLKLR